ncbi:MAG: ATP-binding protein [Solirubrobacteraceae bacterium]
MEGYAQPTSRVWWRRTPTGIAIPLAACGGLVIAVGAVLIQAPSVNHAIAIPVFVLGIGALFGLGLADLARARELPFAYALIGAGVLWSVTALSASSEPGLYTVGRVGQWLVELMIIYLLLVYPSGRFQRPTDRAIFLAGVGLVALLYLPTVVLTHELPHPAAWSTCVSACPSNPFALGHSTPGVVTEVMVPLREALTVVLFGATAAAVTRRWRDAGSRFGRLYAPIVWIAIAQVALFVLFFAVRRDAPASPAVAVSTWSVALSLPAVALACVAGRLYWWALATRALGRVAHEVRSSATVGQVRRAMASALDDPSLRILHSFPGDGGSWIDETGAPAEIPGPTSRQKVTQLESDGWRIAIVHHPALAEAPAVMETVGAYALAALENDSLSEELRSSRQRLAEARGRGIAAEARERRKIERDLHDGAQQRLVAMRLKLVLAAEDLELHDPAGARGLRALGQDVDATIDELRGFARGIYPPLLDKFGLRDALREIGRLCAVPTVVRAEALGRYPAVVEMTVYFCCSEALQNAAKHASGATSVEISVWQAGDLHFEVHDDGPGFDVERTPFGTGLRSIKERLATVNGALELRSGRDQGTTVAAVIPPSRP